MTNTKSKQPIRTLL